MASKKYNWLKRTDRGWLAKPAACYLGPNARTVIDSEKLERLQAQITGVGVREPLLVRRTPGPEDGQHLQIWDGQRRHLAVSELIAQGEPIEWIPVQIKQGSDADMMIAAAQTVTGKEPLDPVDEAGMVTMLLGYGLETEEIATRLGVSVAWVNRRRKLQRLEPKARKVLREGGITIGRAEELAKLSGDKQLAKLPKPPTSKGTTSKPQGKQHKRPGKKQIRALATRLNPSYVEPHETVDSWQLIQAVLQWVAGDIDQKELQSLVGLDLSEPPADTTTAAEPTASEAPPNRENQETTRANPMMAKVQQALGVTVPPSKPSHPGEA